MLLDNNNPNLEWARSPYDLRHVFKANYYYELPYGKGKHWSGNKVMNGVTPCRRPTALTAADSSGDSSKAWAAPATDAGIGRRRSAGSASDPGAPRRRFNQYSRCRSSTPMSKPRSSAC